MREADPFTDFLACACDCQTLTRRSRFEVDLNRRREEALCAVPEDCWGLESWRPEAGETVRPMALEEHAAFDRLLEETLRRVERAVDRVAPEGRGPLGAAEAVECGCALGLEVAARWGRGGTDVQQPKVLRDMRRGLGRALKEAGYDFARRHVRTAAPHYHALGRNDVTEADRAICAIGDAYSLLLDVTPVNAAHADAVLARSGRRQAPDFHYRPLAMDPADLKRRLWRIDLRPVEDPALHDLLEAKRQEVDREITLLDNRCGRRFLADSLALFGGVDRSLRDLALSVLDVLPPRPERRDVGVPPPDLCRRAEAELARLRALDPSLSSRVELRSDVAGLLVSRGDLLVGADTHVPTGRVAALLQHKVGTHVLARHNGNHQPLRQFGAGMAGYEETQEGIAVLAEYLVGGLTGGRLRLLAARVLAVDALVAGAEFAEVVRLLSADHGLSSGAAFRVAMRVFRGGGLTKDTVYLRGFSRVLDQIACGTPLPDMLVGKITLDAWSTVEELRWRGIAKPPRLLPSYLDDPAARARLDRIAAGMTVHQIAEEAGA